MAVWKTLVLDVEEDVKRFLSAVQKQDRVERGYRIPRGVLLGELLRQLPQYAELMSNGHAPPKKQRKRK